MKDSEKGLLIEVHASTDDSQLHLNRYYIVIKKSGYHSQFKCFILAPVGSGCHSSVGNTDCQSAVDLSCCPRPFTVEAVKHWERRLM